MSERLPVQKRRAHPDTLGSRTDSGYVASVEEDVARMEAAMPGAKQLLDAAARTVRMVEPRIESSTQDLYGNGVDR